MPQFTCFARLPFDIRFQIWGLALRQHTHCVHYIAVDTVIPTQIPGTLYGLYNTTSASASDIGLYQACTESHVAFLRRYSKLALQSESYNWTNRSPYLFYFSTHGPPDAFITIHTKHDLVILQASSGNPWPLSLWPLMRLGGALRKVINIGFEYDASWLAGLDDITYQSLLREETPRGCFARITHEIILRPLVIWLIDQTITPDSTLASELTPEGRVFYHGSTRFRQVKCEKEAARGSAFTFLNTFIDRFPDSMLDKKFFKDPEVGILMYN